MNPRRLAALAAVGLVATLTACAPSAPAAAPAPSHPLTLELDHIVVETDVEYGRVDGEPLLLDACLPNGNAAAPRPALVQVHGGGWARGSKDGPSWQALCRYLADAGYVVFSIDYRLAPVHTFPAQLDDVQAAISWARSPGVAERYGVDPARIGAIGDSAGGNLAALAGTAGTGPVTTGARVAAVVDLSGPVDLTAEGQQLAEYGRPTFDQTQLDYLGCDDFAGCDAARAASPGYAADASDPPFLVVHARDDWVPVEQSERLVEQLRDAGVETRFERTDGAEHALAVLDERVSELVVAFLDEHLSPAGP